MAIERLTGIVLDTVKYSDRHNIVTLFAREQGRVAMLVSASQGKTARVRNAMLMPLSVISSDVNFMPTRELQYLNKFTREITWREIYFSPVKSAIGMFVAEFVSAYVRQSPPDPSLWDYIVASLKALDAERHSPANIHIAFLIGFLDHAGIKPDLTGWRKDAWFDLRGGTTLLTPPPHRDYLSPQLTSQLPLLNRMTLRNARCFRFSAAERRQLISLLLRYYSLHFPGLNSLKSPEVLAEVFNF